MIGFVVEQVNLYPNAQPLMLGRGIPRLKALRLVPMLGDACVAPTISEIYRTHQ